jgi:cytochrome c oxidase assembly protein subunit 15
MNLIILRRLINIALFLALSVLMLGAYTRLTDAGLGCPDWPGCYGHIVLPDKQHELSKAQQLYPEQPIESEKAWTEMAHRYLAGSLLGFVLIIMGLLCFHPKFKGIARPIYLILMIGLMVFQALLGMWTVTLKLLPPVVMGHLLGGFLIFSVLVVLRSYFFEFLPLGQKKWRWVLIIGVLITFLQVALGGWVSSNYAAISCLGFPMCNGLWVPPLAFAKAFNIFQSIGPNYQGGLLDIDARITIQWAHRFWAFLVWTFWFCVSLKLIRTYKIKQIYYAVFILQFVLSMQIILGIINVVYNLPLFSAVLHNGFGSLVLASSIILTIIVVGHREH